MPKSLRGRLKNWVEYAINWLLLCVSNWVQNDEGSGWSPTRFYQSSWVTFEFVCICLNCSYSSYLRSFSFYLFLSRTRFPLTTAKTSTWIRSVELLELEMAQNVIFVTRGIKMSVFAKNNSCDSDCSDVFMTTFFLVWIPSLYLK